jgi:myo-inositol-1-phosphate synthase
MSDGAGAGRGKLAVLMPGMGAVATTFVAGVELVKQGRAQPIGSFTQLGIVPDRSVAGRNHKVRELLPLVAPEDLVFGGWDIRDESGAQVAERSEVLSAEHLEAARPALEALRPRPGVHDPDLVKRITANHVVELKHHRAKVERIREDVRELKRSLGASRAVMLFTASTEAYRAPGEAVSSLQALERALEKSDRSVTPTMLYAYAALQEGVPFVNGTPNLCLDTNAFRELAKEKRVVVAGKDFKSGQTMIKTALAPALKARLLGLRGWFSTNILGNRDGEVLDDPQNFRSKEVTKGGVLEAMLSADEQPELYGEVTHKISIHFYPPRGDAKEGWDNVDLFGWLGYPMQLKVNFLCRDSILAAPLVLDLALLADVAQRAGRLGIQEWLSFYFKSPAAHPGRAAQHDLFAQHRMLEDGVWSLSEAVRARAARGLTQVA